MDLKILYDRNMLLGKKLFSRLGDARAYKPQTITHEDLINTNLLFTRNTSPIPRELIQDTDLHFIGNAAAGANQISKQIAQECGIKFVSAPGCNAESVADFTISALLSLSQNRGFSLKGKTLGIVGVGHIGRLVSISASACLQMRVLRCDPPRKDDPTDREAQSFVPFERIIAESDVITFHVPLMRDGQYPTYRYFAGDILKNVKHGAILINNARGAVIDEEAVLQMLESGQLSDVLIDTWCNEPNFNLALAERAYCATPHIAGLTYEGMVNSEIAVYRAACKYLQFVEEDLPKPPRAQIPKMTINCEGRSEEEVLFIATQAIRNTETTSRRFKRIFTKSPERLAKRFNKMRADYPVHREFTATTVRLVNPPEDLAEKLSILGFNVEVC